MTGWPLWSLPKCCVFSFIQPFHTARCWSPITISLILLVLFYFIHFLGSKCSGFHSCFTCACGQPAYAHETVVETKEERLAQGKPVGQDVPYAAMGGLTGFSSLAEGYMRLDDSGIGMCSWPEVKFYSPASFEKY